MPGTYIVNYSDPSKTPIEIPPLGADGSTSMRMVGYRAPVYGEILWENFLHLLEQFAGANPPANPAQGQIWAKNSVTPPQLFYYDPRATTNLEHVKWHLIDTAQIQYTSTPPANTELLWYDSASSTLRYFDGDTWDAMTPISSATSPSNPYNGQLWHDTATATMRYWSGTTWSAMTAVSSGSAPSNPNIGDLWHDTTTGTLRYHAVDGSWYPLTNIASNTPPTSPYNGQLWLNTSSTPPEMFYRDDSTTSIPSLPGWHRTSAGMHIGSTAPAWNEGVWFNPTTGALNVYTGGVWTNILVTNFAGTCDYNAMVADVNVLLGRVGEPALSTVSGTVSAGNWNALFDAVRYLATFRNIPYPKPVDIKNLPGTLGVYSSDSACGIYSLRRRLRIVEQAICAVGGSTTVNPVCFEDQPTASVQTRSTPWNTYTHTVSATYGSPTALSQFFELGGYLTWTGSITAPENNVNDAWEGLMVALSGVKIRNTSTSFAGQTSPVGALDLTGTEQLIALVSGTTRSTATAEVYGTRVGSVITLRLVLIEHDTAVGVTGSLLSSFSSVRVGAPCKPTPPPFPSFTGSGGGTLPNPTYSIVPNSLIVPEGGTVNFAVTTTNVPDGTVLKWVTELGGGMTAADFSDSALAGNVTIIGGSGTITRTIASDSFDDDGETFQIALYPQGSAGTNPSEQHAISSAVTIGNVRSITVNSYTVVNTGVAGGSGPPPPPGHVPTNSITTELAIGGSGDDRIWFNITVSGVTASQTNPLSIVGKVSPTSTDMNEPLVVYRDPSNTTAPIGYVTTNGTMWVSTLNYLTNTPPFPTPVPGTYPWSIKFEGVVYDTFDLVITA